jgi:hypothetical protein
VEGFGEEVSFEELAAFETVPTLSEAFAGTVLVVG